MATRRLSPKAFVKSASGHQTGGAWLVYGFDEYIKTETVRLAARAFIGEADHRFAVTHLVGAETDCEEILQCTQLVPMLSLRSVVIVHDLHRLAPAHKTRLAGRLGFVPGTCMLICQGPSEPDKRTRLYQWFMESGRDVVCDPLTPVAAETFARRRLEEFGSTAPPDALARLLARTGPDAGRIAREAEKLVLFAGAGITSADVDTVAGFSVGCTLEDLVGGLVTGLVPESLYLARKLRQSGMDAGTVIGRLSGHFFDLKRAAGSQARQSWPLASALRVPRSKAEELLSWLRTCREEQLEMALHHLASADRSVRSGTADADLVCDQLVLAIASTFASRTAKAT